MTLAVQNLRVRSLDVDKKEVTWELGESLAEALDYTYEIFRSESPGGPWDLISPPFVDRYIFVDRRVPLGDKFVVLYYKLRVTSRAGEVQEFGPASQGADVSLFAQAIRRQELTYFTQIVGRSCWLFKKRVFGPRCTTCWDKVMHKRTVDRCLECFGTGMLRGYHNPIEVWMQIDPSSKVQQNQGQQIAQFVSTAGRMSFYPNVSPGDIVVEAENRRWRVQNVSTSEHLRAPVKQELVLRQLEEKDIEFRLPIKVEMALRDIQASPVKMFDNASDLNTAIEARTPALFAAYMAYPFDDQDS